MRDFICLYCALVLCRVFGIVALIRPDDSVLVESAAHAQQTLKVFIYPKIPDPSYPEYRTFQSYNRSEAEFECNPHFQMERIFPRYLRDVGVVVSDPSQADFFLIDHDYACLQSTNRNNSHGPYPNEFRQKYLTSLIQNVIQNFPYYNASGGFDHLMMFTIDSGRCELSAKGLEQVFPYYSPVTFIGNFGFAKEDVAYEVMKRGKEAFNYKSSTIRQQPGCTLFGTGRNIVIPQYHHWKKQRHIPSPRPFHSLFVGFIKRGGMSGVNVRPMLSQIHSMAMHDGGFFCSDIRDGKAIPKVTVSDAYFSLCPGGSAPWSVRMYDALFHHSVPVILADGIVLPFEKFLDWRSFTVKRSSDFKTLQDGVKLLDSLKTLSEGFRRLKGFHGRKVSSLMETSSLPTPKRNYISQKIQHAEQAMPWLSWNASSPHSAYGLLMLELWCRKYGSVNELCNPKHVNNGSELAFTDYW